ncbi:hypothetical protein ACLFKT_44010, partial [Paraburkholderia sp. BR14261]
LIALQGLATRRADRCVMLLTNTLSIRFVAILALGPSGGQRNPVIHVSRPIVYPPRRDRSRGSASNAL